MIAKWYKECSLLLLATAVCGSLLLIAGCTGGGTGTTEVVTVETVTEELPTEAPDSKTNLVVWLPDYPAELAVSEWWLDTFMEENGDITLEWQYVPVMDLKATLGTAAAASLPPDIALVDYNIVAAFKDLGSLLPVGDFIDWDSYLAEALDLVIFDGQLYAVPWLRAGCSADYQYLALFDNNPAKVDEAARFLNFLTQTQFQAEFFNAGGWNPTNPMLYDEFAIGCNPISVIRLDPALISSTIEAVRIDAATLSPLLGSQVLNAEKATAVTINNFSLRAAPVNAAPTAAEAMDQLNSSGLL